METRMDCHYFMLCECRHGFRKAGCQLPRSAVISGFCWGVGESRCHLSLDGKPQLLSLDPRPSTTTIPCSGVQSSTRALSLSTSPPPFPCQRRFRRMCFQCADHALIAPMAALVAGIVSFSLQKRRARPLLWRASISSDRFVLFLLSVLAHLDASFCALS